MVDAPHMVATLPTDGQEVRSRVPSAYTDYSSRPTLEWTLPKPGLDVFQGVLSLWVDVQGTYVHAGAPTGGCFWDVRFEVVSTTGDFHPVASSCVPEQPLVESGIRLREFAFAVPFNFTNAEGDTLSVKMGTLSPGTPGSSIHVLSGSAVHPSAITIEGLRLPLDTRTLL